jgi:hypothetical protein
MSGIGVIAGVMLGSQSIHCFFFFVFFFHGGIYYNYSSLTVSRCKNEASCALEICWSFSFMSPERLAKGGKNPMSSWRINGRGLFY